MAKCHNGAIIDGTPYSFRRKGGTISFQNIEDGSLGGKENVWGFSLYSRLASIMRQFKQTVAEWEELIESSFSENQNLFLAPNDLKLVEKMTKEVGDIIKTVEVKMNNVVMMLG